MIGSSDLRGDVSGQAILRLRSADNKQYVAYISFGPIANAAKGVYARTDAVTGHIVQLDATTPSVHSPRGSTTNSLSDWSSVIAADSGPVGTGATNSKASLQAAWPRCGPLVLAWVVLCPFGLFC